jgi:hypothetical protein
VPLLPDVSRFCKTTFPVVSGVRANSHPERASSMAFAVLLRGLARRRFLLEKSTTVKSPRLAEYLVRAKVLQSGVQIHALRTAAGTERFDEEMLPYLRKSVEDCARCDPAWAAWATARSRNHSTYNCGPRSIDETIRDILTQVAEAHRDP